MLLNERKINAIQAFQRRISHGPSVYPPCRPDTSPKPAARMLHALLSPGAWGGRPAFLVGGGPSLSSFDWSRLATENTIAINRAWEVVPNPNIIFSMDKRYLDWIATGAFGADKRSAFFTYSNGIRVFVDTKRNRSLGIDVYTVDNYRGENCFSHSLIEGVCCRSNSGYGALNLAIILGANPIYLLGYDMHGSAGRQKWFHNGYPAIQPDSVYRGMIRDFERCAKLMNSKAAIVNLNAHSGLKCFDFGDIANVPVTDFPVVVAYYTKNTPYEDEVKQLQTSCYKTGMNMDIVGIDSLGGWQKNTQAKGEFILGMIKKYWGRSILYTDADSTIRRFPEMFLNFPSDIGVHLHKGKELLSGTIYLRCNDTTLQLVTEWINTMQKSPDVWDQRCLDRIIPHYSSHVTYLPAEYCCIFDAHPEIQDPYIVHYQASRRLKREVGK